MYIIKKDLIFFFLSTTVYILCSSSYKRHELLTGMLPAQIFLPAAKIWTELLSEKQAAWRTT